MRRNFRASKTISKQFRNQNDLLLLFNFVHDIVLLIISVKYFCNFLMLSFICSFVFEFLIDETHFFISFTFFAFIDFQSFRNTIDVITMFSSIFVNICYIATLTSFTTMYPKYSLSLLKCIYSIYHDFYFR